MTFLKVPIMEKKMGSGILVVRDFVKELYDTKQIYCNNNNNKINKSFSNTRKHLLSTIIGEKLS